MQTVSDTTSPPDRVLVLGGNGWLGSLVAEYAAARGASVTCLARGRRGTTPPGARLVRGDRSRPDAYDGVREQDWDEVVDVTWQPGFARSAVAALADKTQHWTYVSSCAVYADHLAEVATGDAAVVAAHGPDTAGDDDYGPAKAACEQAVSSALGQRAAILRSGLLVGPGDVSDRFGYWVARMAAHPDGPVLVPDGVRRAVQYLDVRDLARWMVTLAPRGVTGTFDAVGDTRPLRRVVEASAALTGFRGELVAAPSEELARHGVAPWFGPRSLPLWLPDGFDAGFTPGNPAAARRAGLTNRPLESTLRDTLVDEQNRGLERGRRAGMTRADELAVISSLTRRAVSTD